MKLKHVELYAFKSFAEKTRLTFNKDISAIVGPNGSGKSNIADAVRWVLGEQSAKSLRGSSMQDVIFSGSESKKPMNMAQVSLVLDNSEKLLPIDFDEVNITRRVFRTGESEYLINKSQVRLTDIRELFLDTGIGKDGYSLIGQGRIDEILSGKPEERREIFEEASGIAKNKYKKTKAERRLLRNEEDLDRLGSEIKIKQQEADILEKQAKNAKEGIQLSSKLELLELNLLKQEIGKASNTLENDESKLDLINSELKEKTAQLSKITDLIGPIQDQIKEKEKELEILKEEDINSERRKQNIESNIGLAQEKIKFYKTDIKRLEDDIALKNARLKNLNENLSKFIKDQADLEKSKTGLEKDLDHTKIKIKDLSNQMKEAQEEKTGLDISLLDLRENLSNIRIDKSTKEKLDDSNAKLIETYEKELKKLNDLIEEKEKDKSKNQKAKEDLLDNISKIDKEHSSNDKSIEELREDLKDLQEEIIEKRNSYLKLESEKNILERQYKSYDGYYKSVQKFLKLSETNPDIKDRVKGVLADLISIDDKYAEALEVALASALQNIIVENEEDGKYLIEYIKKNNIGRLTFLPISRIRGYKNDVDHPLVIDILNNLVNYDSRIEGIIDYYLSKTALVKDMDDAIKASKDLKTYRVITLEGDLINSWGSMVGGKSFKKEQNSLLNRKKELQELNKTLKAQGEGLKEFNDKYVNYDNKLNKLISDQDLLKEKKGNLSEKLRELESNIYKIETEISFNQNRKNDFLNMIRDARNELKTVDYSNIDDINKEIEIKEDQVKKLEARISDLSSSIQDEDRKLVKLNSQLEVSNRDIFNLKGDVENTQIDIENDEKSLSNDLKLLELTKEELEKANKNILANAKELESFEEGHIRHEKINGLVKLLTDMKDNIEVQRKELENLRIDLSENEKEKYRLELKIENAKQKVESLRLDYMDTYSIDEEILEDKFSRLELVEASRKEVNQIKARLSKIGYFNYESIEEFNEISQELDFMNKQYEDLLVTREDLSKLIKSIEKEMRETFTESFEEIRKRFNKIFQILFDGGEADLKFDSDDVLTAGIEIIARPEGKRLKSIDLLSGGERAMTAVALLFAIFEINPSPFCVLDEIDAALDEANIKRYINYLKSLTDKTQFIIITHRKATMEMADILYGVTMEEQGVSKLITLALDDFS